MMMSGKLKKERIKSWKDLHYSFDRSNDGEWHPGPKYFARLSYYARYLDFLSQKSTRLRCREKGANVRLIWIRSRTRVVYVPVEWVLDWGRCLLWYLCLCG